MICGDAVAFLIVAIHDRQLGMKSEVPRLKSSSQAGRERLVFCELAGLGIEAKLIDRIWAGLGHEGTALGLSAPGLTALFSASA